MFTGYRIGPVKKRKPVLHVRGVVETKFYVQFRWILVSGGLIKAKIQVRMSLSTSHWEQTLINLMMFQHNWGMWFVCYSSTRVIRPPWHYIACFISSGHMHDTWQAMSSKMHMSSSLLHWMWCTATVKNPTLFQQQTHTIVIALSIRSSPEDYSLMLYAKLASEYVRSAPG